MRSRYYSPILKRFVNADILHGSISDSTSLNRYSYVNGNPISCVDPFGLVVEDKSGNVNINELYGLFTNVNGNGVNDPELLRLTLKQLLSYKNMFNSSVGSEIVLHIDPNTTISYSTSVIHGDGNLEVSVIMSEQLELLNSFSFPVSDGYEVVKNSDGSIGIRYSYDINDYSSVSASILTNPGVSLSADYAITTKDDYHNSVSTSLGLEHTKNSNKQMPNRLPATVPVTTEEPLTAIDWGFVRDVAIAMGVSVIAFGALAETFATGGAGVWNDTIAVGAAIESWQRVLA